MTIYRFLRNDWSLGATATSENEVANPLAKPSVLFNYSPSTRYATSGLSNIRVTVDAGSSLPWDTVFLGYSNASSGATLRVTADDTAGNLFSSPDYDSGNFTFRVPASGDFVSWHAWHQAEVMQTHRYIGLWVTDGSNPDGFFNAGICFIGTLFTPSVEAELSDQPGYDDRSILIEMANGEKRARRRPRKRVFDSISWSALNESDAMFFDELNRTYGKSTPFIVRREPNDLTYQQHFLSLCYAQSYRGPSQMANRGLAQGELPGPRFKMDLSVEEV